MANLLVTRFPNGVTNVAENDLFCNLAMPDPDAVPYVLQ